ncbi:hypothetical protein LguiA_016506 [Lonicera macranthoides]
MEEEKKKKRNRKKKNKQSKTTESASVSAGESVASDHNHAKRIEKNHQSQDSDTSNAKDDLQKVDVESREYHANGTEGPLLLEAEKLYWLDREGSLEEKIQQLQKEKDVHREKEADLEMKMLQLQGEKASWLQKEAGYEERINQMVDGAATLSLRGVGLDEKIREMEKERDSWVQKEIKTEETIASVNSDNARLQAQVLESEELKNKLLQENQHLMEKISGLQSHIQNLERNNTASAHSYTENIKSLPHVLGTFSAVHGLYIREIQALKHHAAENEELKSELEAARALVEKLLSENSELVEKVNELYVELDQKGPISALSSSVGSDSTVVGAPLGSNPMVGTAGKPPTSAHDPPMFKPSERISVTGDGIMDSLENVTLNSERDGGGNSTNDEIIPNSPETIKSEEIVQIPLDENEEANDTDLKSSHNEEKVEVPISDAPLIGAPFRLISFVARYVSGADLVNNTGR